MRRAHVPNARPAEGYDDRRGADDQRFRVAEGHRHNLVAWVPGAQQSEAGLVVAGEDIGRGGLSPVRTDVSVASGMR